MSAVVLKHYVKGRARFKAACFGDEACAQKIVQRLQMGIREVTVNTKCKSIVVYFDEQKITLEFLIGKVTALFTKRASIKNRTKKCQTCSSRSCLLCRPLEPLRFAAKNSKFIHSLYGRFMKVRKLTDMTLSLFRATSAFSVVRNFFKIALIL